MTLPFIRYIDNSDKVHVAQQQADMYYNVVIGPRIQFQPLVNEKQGQLPLNREGWLKLLTAPLTWLVQHHPSLSAVVGDHLKANPAYLKMPSVDLSRVISYQAIKNTLEINRILEDEHNNPCDLSDHTLPLWRIVVVHVQDDDTFHLLFSFQVTMHALFIIYFQTIETEKVHVLYIKILASIASFSFVSKAHYGRWSRNHCADRAAGRAAEPRSFEPVFDSLAHHRPITYRGCPRLNGITHRLHPGHPHVAPRSARHVLARIPQKGA